MVLYIRTLCGGSGTEVRGEGGRDLGQGDTWQGKIEEKQGQRDLWTGEKQRQREDKKMRLCSGKGFSRWGGGGHGSEDRG